MPIQRIDIPQNLIPANAPLNQAQRRQAGNSLPDASPSVSADGTGGKRGLAELQSAADELNRAAGSVRTADTAMAQIHDFITTIKAQLVTIVKNYPPFPPGSEERVQALKSFAAFRKQIDQLTIPPVDRGASMIMADPAVVPGAGGLEVAPGKNLALTGRPVHTGPAGLDLPALAEDAGDHEIAAMIGKLDKALKTLDARRAGLAGDALRLIGEAVGSPARDDADAEGKSREMRDLMASAAGASLAGGTLPAAMV